MSQTQAHHPLHTSSSGALPMTPTDPLSVNSYYPEPPSDVTGGLPINLDSLRDGPPGSKPFYPYSTLIRYAIKGSPTQKLLLEDIYYAIESRFPYFRSAPAGWKNSVRHNLSLNPCFEKVPRPLTDRGKGSYWTVNDNVDPRTGVHRVRKKRTGKSKSHSDDLDGEYVPDDTNGTSSSAGTLKSPGFESPVTAHPFAAHEHPFSPSPQATLPEIDDQGNIIWRAAWKNELAKLQTLTSEQDKLLAEPEWYREMLFRVRTAMMAPIDQNGVLQMGTSVYQPEPSGQQHHDVENHNPGQGQQDEDIDAE